MIHRSPHPDVDLNDEPLLHLVLRGLATRGDEVAVIDTGTNERLSGSAMTAWIRHETICFQQAGLRPGEVVALAGPGGAAWLAAAFGAIGAGLTVLPLNPMVPAPLASSQLEAASAVAVIASPSTVEWANEAAGGLRPVVLMAGSGAGQADADQAIEAWSASVVDTETDVFLLPSSGTTGLPKLVRVTHRVIGATAQLVPPALGFVPDDTMLVALPLFHAGGLVVATIPLTVGARLVVQPTFDPEAFVAAIEAHRVTGTVVVPPICHALLTHPTVGDHDLTSLRFVHSTAAPLAPPVQERLAQRLGCLVGQGLGLSEALPVSLAGIDQPVVAGSCGPAVPNTELRLVDPETGDDITQPNGVGELWVRGPQVMAGYHNDPDATAAALTPDRWLRTGDLCRIDGDGNVFVVDRLKELIKVSGYQVAPAAIEAILLRHPAIDDCAVVGRPDPRRGEVPVAWVVTRCHVEATELIELAARETPPYARLVDVFETDAIPRNPTGKILRRALLDRHPTSTARA